jgi:hypothetical protein
MPEQGPYVYTPTGQGSDQFDRLGHPGKYVTAVTYTSGQLDLTGSNYGYGSIIVKTHGNATASLSAGGQIILGDLTAGVIYDLSLAQIKGGTNSIIYVLKRQGI